MKLPCSRKLASYGQKPCRYQLDSRRTIPTVCTRCLLSTVKEAANIPAVFDGGKATRWNAGIKISVRNEVCLRNFHSATNPSRAAIIVILTEGSFLQPYPCFICRWGEKNRRTVKLPTGGMPRGRVLTELNQCVHSTEAPHLMWRVEFHLCCKLSD